MGSTFRIPPHHPYPELINFVDGLTFDHLKRAVDGQIITGSKWLLAAVVPPKTTKGQMRFEVHSVQRRPGYKDVGPTATLDIMISDWLASRYSLTDVQNALKYPATSWEKAVLG